MSCRSRLRIREALVSDIGRIVEIERRSFRYPYSPMTFVTLLSLYPRYFLVCECCGKTVGYITAVVDRDGYGHVMSVAVDPDYRGLGIGKRLMEAVEARLSNDGIKQVRLEVAVNNSVAIKMYEELGYRVVRILRSYYPDGEDAYLMVKSLVC